MRKFSIWTTGLLVLTTIVQADDKAEKNDKPEAPKTVTVKMVTTMGDIVLELNAERAPITVRNFLRYTDEKFFDGTVFHRVISNFMIQGGGFTEDLKQKKTNEMIKNESKNGLKNNRGTIAMARTSAPHSATAQFFINVKDNNNLDYPSAGPWGYCVFGKVIEGMDVVDKIKAVKTKNSRGTTVNGRPMPLANVPSEPVVIRSVRRETKAKESAEPEAKPAAKPEAEKK